MLFAKGLLGLVNVHTCRCPEAGTDLSAKLKPRATLKREVRGCLRKDGTCSARFPSAVFTRTEVDPKDGYINIKKLEPMLNTVTPDLKYLLRCNTDVTSLLSRVEVSLDSHVVSDLHTIPTVQAELFNRTSYIFFRFSLVPLLSFSHLLIQFFHSHSQIYSPAARTSLYTLHWQAISHQTSRWFYISLSWGL